MHSGFARTRAFGLRLLFLNTPGSLMRCGRILHALWVCTDSGLRPSSFFFKHTWLIDALRRVVACIVGLHGLGPSALVFFF